MTTFTALAELVAPRRSVRWFTGAAWRIVVPLFGVAMAIETVLIVAIWLQRDLETWGWQPGPTTAAATVGTNVPVGAVGEGSWQVRTVSQVWHDWHSDPARVSPVIYAAVASFAGGGLILPLLALLNLPFVHRSGAVWISYMRALRAMGIVAYALLVVTAGFMLGGDYFRRFYEPLLPIYDTQPLSLLMGALLMCWVAWVLWRAARFAQPEDAPTVSPRCEGCGYDLTHLPASGRCTECGLPLEESLDVGRSRPDAIWPRRRSFAAFIRSTVDLLLRPGGFYRRLRLRTPAASEYVFAGRHFLAIWLVAFVWLIGLAHLDRSGLGFTPTPGALLWYLVPPTTVGVFCLWCGYRIAVGVVGNWWVFRQTLPDGAWAVRVFCYESAYLWVFCAFWGLLVTSFTFGGPWMTHLLPSHVRLPFGLFPEFYALALGSGTLIAIWLWRFASAARAIRWTNY